MQEQTANSKVTILTGPLTKDHHRELVKRIADDLARHPTGQVFYLVPNHIAFEIERSTYQALSQDPRFANPLAPDVHAFGNIQISAFDRLLWYFLQKDPKYTALTATDTAQTMVLSKILVEYGEDLQLYRGEVHNPGFLEQLRLQLGELANAGIDADILTLLQDAEGTQEFHAKMHDLTIIARAFQEELGRYFVSPEERFAYSIKQFQAHPEWFADTRIYVSGFDRLDASFLSILQVLMRLSVHTTVDLIGDEGDLTGQTDQDAAPFFAPTKRLYTQLTESAPGAINLVAVSEEAAYTPTMAKLADYWVASARGLPVTDNATNKGVKIWQAATRQDELTAVTAEIKRLVASGHYRYGDMRILTPDLAQYETIIRPTFQQAGVPYFYDRAVQMTDHPLVQVISAIGELINGNVTYANLFSLLRTELVLPKEIAAQAAATTLTGGQTPVYLATFRNQVDAAENYTLGHGLQGSQFAKKDPWQEANAPVSEEDDEVSAISTHLSAGEPIHLFIRNELLPFVNKLKKAADGKSALTLLYHFLTQHGLISQFTFFRNTTQQSGDPVGADRPRQAFAVFTRLLDEYVQILGDQPFSTDDFTAIFSAGFNAASYKQIPAVIDTVQIADLGVTTAANAKVTFIIGGTANALPAPVESTSLLSDRDRESILALQDQLSAKDPDQAAALSTLSGGTEDRLAASEYIAYKAFFSATERLYLCYPQLQAEESQRISPYYDRIQRHLNLIPVYVDFSGEGLVRAQTQQYIGHWLATPSLAGSWVVKALRVDQQNLFWQTVAWHLQHSDTKQRQNYYQFILSALNYENRVGQLSPDIVQDLYGNHLNVSVSRLEQYYQNPYEYFLQYGLRLTERDTYDLTPAETGSFYHWVLDHLIKMIHAQQQDIAHLDDQTLADMVQEIAGAAVHEPFFAILNGSGRMKFLRQLLARTLQYMAWLLKEQAERSALRPLATEVLFGQAGMPGGLPALEYPLGREHSVRIRGKIDRIDGFHDQETNQDFLTVIDYKSSSHQFEYGQALYGLSLQLQTYLQALLNALGKPGDLALPGRATVAGGFYLHINEPLLPMADALKKKDSAEQIFTETMLKKNQFKGIVLADDAFLTQADTSPQRTILLAGTSNTKKSGYRNKNALTQTDMDTILTYNEYMIRRAAASILAGDIALRPARFADGRTLLSYSPYQNVMYFDHMLKENQYMPIPKLDDPQSAIRQMQERMADNHE